VEGPLPACSIVSELIPSPADPSVSPMAIHLPVPGRIGVGLSDAQK
jgi:hypothetical protein